MRKQLLGTLWLLRVAAVALGILIITALLSLQSDLGALWALGTFQDAGGARGAAWSGAVSGAVRGDQQGRVDLQDGVVDGEQEEDEGEQQQLAFSLDRISRLLGWRAQAGELTDREQPSEEYDLDRIRLKDLRPLDEVGQAAVRPGAGPGAWQQGPSTEWSDSVLLRAFITRFGAGGSSGTPGPLDLDGGEMSDFQAATDGQPRSRTPSPPSSSVAPAVEAEMLKTEAPPLPLLPVCPMNGIITVQNSEGIANKILGYSMAWLIARSVGVGWRTPLVPVGTHRELTPLFSRLTLSTLEQLPLSCRPEPRVLEDSGLQESDLVPKNLPIRFIDPKTPLVINRGVFLPSLLEGNLDALREELSLRVDMQDAASAVLGECLHQLLGGQEPGQDTVQDDGQVEFVAVHVWRNQTAKWLSPKYRRVGADYFRSALAHFRSRARLGGKPLFVVTTDDVRWVREQLPGRDVCVLGAAGDIHGHLDLAVQASCKHSVVDLSATSMAAALLASGAGETVSPRSDRSHAAQLVNIPGWTFI